MIKKESMMEMTNQPKSKKEWSQPELLVMTRSNPEEAVLTNCKGNGGSTPGVDFSGCNIAEGLCGGCLSIGVS